MLAGMVEWHGTLTDFYRGTIRGSTEIEVALRAVDNVMEAVFGRQLGLFAPLLPRIKNQMHTLCLSPMYVVHTVNEMLELFYVRMRGTTAKTRRVDLSVEANWRETWHQIVQACEMTTSGNTEFNLVGKWPEMRGGPVTPHREGRRTEGSYRAADIKPRRLEGRDDRSPDRGMDRGRDRNRHREREGDRDRGRGGSPRPNRQRGRSHDQDTGRSGTDNRDRGTRASEGSRAPRGDEDPAGTKGRGGGEVERGCVCSTPGPCPYEHGQVQVWRRLPV
jgi:hypothetical protein